MSVPSVRMLRAKPLQKQFVQLQKGRMSTSLIGHQSELVEAHSRCQCLCQCECVSVLSYAIACWLDRSDRVWSTAADREAQSCSDGRRQRHR